MSTLIQFEYLLTHTDVSVDDIKKHMLSNRMSVKEVIREYYGNVNCMDSIEDYDIAFHNAGWLTCVEYDNNNTSAEDDSIRLQAFKLTGNACTAHITITLKENYIGINRLFTDACMDYPNGVMDLIQQCDRLVGR